MASDAVGIRIATAINVGTAPLAFLIGASSYGELIFRIYLNDFPTLILGATATALFALILDTLLARFGRRLALIPSERINNNKER